MGVRGGRLHDGGRGARRDPPPAPVRRQRHAPPRRRLQPAVCSRLQLCRRRHPDGLCDGRDAQRGLPRPEARQHLARHARGDRPAHLAERLPEQARPRHFDSAAHRRAGRGPRAVHRPKAVEGVPASPAREDTLARPVRSRQRHRPHGVCGGGLADRHCDGAGAGAPHPHTLTPLATGSVWRTLPQGSPNPDRCSTSPPATRTPPTRSSSRSRTRSPRSPPSTSPSASTRTSGASRTRTFGSTRSRAPASRPPCRTGHPSRRCRLPRSTSSGNLPPPQPSLAASP